MGNTSVVIVVVIRHEIYDHKQDDCLFVFFTKDFRSSYKTHFVPNFVFLGGKRKSFGHLTVGSRTGCGTSVFNNRLSSEAFCSRSSLIGTSRMEMYVIALTIAESANFILKQPLCCGCKTLHKRHYCEVR